MKVRLGIRARNLSLHAKIAISVSLIVTAIFAALFYVYSSTAKTLVAEENQRRAELTAIQLAQHISSE